MRCRLLGDLSDAEIYCRACELWISPHNWDDIETLDDLIVMTGGWCERRMDQDHDDPNMLSVLEKRRLEEDCPGR